MRKGYYKANNRSFKLKFTKKERKLSDLLLVLQSLERCQNTTENRGYINTSIRELEEFYKLRTDTEIKKDAIRNLINTLIKEGDLELIESGNGGTKTVYFLPQFYKTRQAKEKNQTSSDTFKASNNNSYNDKQETETRQAKEKNQTRNKNRQETRQENRQENRQGIEALETSNRLKVSVFSELENLKTRQETRQENRQETRHHIYIRTLYNNIYEQMQNTLEDKSSMTLSVNESSNIEKVKPKSETKSKSKNKYSIEFEELWKEYPRKLGKPKAYSSYKKLLKEYTHEQILKATLDYKKQIQREKIETKYIKHGSTFYNNTTGGILDFLEEDTNQSSKREEVLLKAKKQEEDVYIL